MKLSEIMWGVPLFPPSELNFEAELGSWRSSSSPNEVSLEEQAIQYLLCRAKTNYKLTHAIWNGSLVAGACGTPLAPYASCRVPREEAVLNVEPAALLPRVGVCAMRVVWAMPGCVAVGPRPARATFPVLWGEQLRCLYFLHGDILCGYGWVVPSSSFA